MLRLCRASLRMRSHSAASASTSFRRPLRPTTTSVGRRRRTPSLVRTRRSSSPSRRFRPSRTGLGITTCPFELTLTFAGTAVHLGTSYDKHVLPLCLTFLWVPARLTGLPVSGMTPPTGSVRHFQSLKVSEWGFPWGRKDCARRRIHPSLSLWVEGERTPGCSDGAVPAHACARLDPPFQYELQTLRKTAEVDGFPGMSGVSAGEFGVICCWGRSCSGGFRSGPSDPRTGCSRSVRFRRSVL